MEKSEYGHKVIKNEESGNKKPPTPEEVKKLVPKDAAIEKSTKEIQVENRQDAILDKWKTDAAIADILVTEETIKDEIKRLKQEGLNADQEDKTDWEDYLDTIAASRRIKELKDKLDKMKNPPQKSDTYITLEQIKKDLDETYYHDSGENVYEMIMDVIEKLEKTIAAQYYIQDGRK